MLLLNAEGFLHEVQPNCLRIIAFLQIFESELRPTRVDLPPSIRRHTRALLPLRHPETHCRPPFMTGLQRHGLHPTLRHGEPGKESVQVGRLRGGVFVLL